MHTHDEQVLAAKRREIFARYDKLANPKSVWVMAHHAFDKANSVIDSKRLNSWWYIAKLKPEWRDEFWSVLFPIEIYILENPGIDHSFLCLEYQEMV